MKVYEKRLMTELERLLGILDFLNPDSLKEERDGVAKLSDTLVDKRADEVERKAELEVVRGNTRSPVNLGREEIRCRGVRNGRVGLEGADQRRVDGDEVLLGLGRAGAEGRAGGRDARGLVCDLRELACLEGIVCRFEDGRLLPETSVSIRGQLTH
jgi:hypothetical protein